MIAALWAGLAYFVAVFAAGFALGTIRVLFVLPLIGEAAAVAIELPVMLAASWLASRWLIRRFGLPARVLHGLVMGGLAFGLLMSAELGLSVLAFGRNLAEHLDHYRTLPGLLGLLGQVAFAAIPAIQLSRSPRNPGPP